MHKALLKHSHTHSLTYCCFLAITVELSRCDRMGSKAWHSYCLALYRKDLQTPAVDPMHLHCPCFTSEERTVGFQQKLPRWHFHDTTLRYWQDFPLAWQHSRESSCRLWDLIQSQRWCCGSPLHDLDASQHLAGWTCLLWAASPHWACHIWRLQFCSLKGRWGQHRCLNPDCSCLGLVWIMSSGQIALPVYSCPNAWPKSEVSSLWASWTWWFASWNCPLEARTGALSGPWVEKG